MSGVLFAVLPASIVASAHVSRQAYYPSLFMCYDILGGKGDSANSQALQHFVRIHSRSSYVLCISHLLFFCSMIGAAPGVAAGFVSYTLYHPYLLSARFRVFQISSFY